MLKDDLIDIIKNRRSIRKFTCEIVSDDDIYRLIEAARYAPSNNNRQPWKFIVLRNEGKKNAIIDAVKIKISFFKEALKNEELPAIIDSYKEYLLFIKDAPVLIFALYKNPPAVVMEFIKEHKFNALVNMTLNELISASMAVQNILLTAHSLGLGTCCTTGPLIAAPEIKIILDIRPPFEIASIIALGHYVQTPEAPVRKSVQDIIEVIN